MNGKQSRGSDLVNPSRCHCLAFSAIIKLLFFEQKLHSKTPVKRGLFIKAMIIIPTQTSSLPPGPGYEHVDPLLITLVSGSGLDAVELSGHSPSVVHQAQVPGNRQITSSA